MKNRFFLTSLSLAFNILVADMQIIRPHQQFIASGAVYDFVIDNNLIYMATGEGIIDIFDMNNSRVAQIEFPKIANFYEDNISPKIYSVDHLDKLTMALIEAEFGKREIFIKKDDDKNIKKIISTKTAIKKAKLIKNNLLIYATLSNELILFDLKNMTEIYNKKIGNSSFSDFEIFENKIAVSSESGEINILNILTGENIEILKGLNLDNVYKLAFYKNIILGAGQDRRVSIYNKNIENYWLSSDFLVYAVAISPDGKFGAFPFNEENEIKIFQIDNKKELFKLSGQKSTLNKILFINNYQIFSSSDDKYLLEWRLK